VMHILMYVERVRAYKRNSDMTAATFPTTPYP
jgi:hypothetical protein